MASDAEKVLAAHAHPGEILHGLGEAWMVCGCGTKFDLPIVDGKIPDPNSQWLAHLAAVLEAEVIRPREREAKQDVIAMLGKRLDLMANDHSPAGDDPWTKGFDDGWHGARLQINESILNPRVDAHIRNPYTDEGWEDR